MVILLPFALLAVWSPMSNLAAHKTGVIRLVLLIILLEVGSLNDLSLPLELVVEVLLHHIGARLSCLDPFRVCVLCLCLFLKIQKPNETLNSHLLSLVFEVCANTPPGLRKLCNMHPATNLPGNAHFRSSSSFAMHCIS